MEKKFEQLKQEVLDNFSEDELYKTSILKTPKLMQTNLYKFFEKMPKGADLHTHGGALTPVRHLIKFVCEHPVLLIDTNPKHKGYLQLENKKPGSTYMPLKKAIENGIFTEAELTELWTLAGCPEGVNVWDWFQDLFAKHNDLNEIGPTCTDYFQNSYEYYCSQNIFHIEQRLFLKGSEADAFEKTHCAFDAYINAKKKYPDLTVRIIPVGLKSNVFNISTTKNIFENTVKMHHQIKDSNDDFIVGIDLVNEEDTSRSISEFQDLINETISKAPNLHLNLHAGETLRSENDEIYKAIKLGSQRIGHGLNLWAHPELIKQIRDNNICLEVCPISNQSLGFCDDLRKHPAKEYLRQDIPMVLCSDDPTYQEQNSLTDDFFLASLAWDLSLDKIKQLCKNSISYSYLSTANKEKLKAKFDKQWGELCEN